MTIHRVRQQKISDIEFIDFTCLFGDREINN